MDTLPLDLLYEIARADVDVFIALAKTIRVFALDLLAGGNQAGMYKWHGYTYRWLENRLDICRLGVLDNPVGPARVYYSGDTEWYKNGVLHRVGGPAIKHGRLTKWYFEGNLHREDGPAIGDNYNGSWYKHGRLHRDTYDLHGRLQPAVINWDPEKRCEYWIDGTRESKKGRKMKQKRQSTHNHS
jgi:hypothetical protein